MATRGILRGHGGGQRLGRLPVVTAQTAFIRCGAGLVSFPHYRKPRQVSCQLTHFRGYCRLSRRNKDKLSIRLKLRSFHPGTLGISRENSGWIYSPMPPELLDFAAFCANCRQETGSSGATEFDSLPPTRELPRVFCPCPSMDGSPWQKRMTREHSARCKRGDPPILSAIVRGKSCATNQ